MVMVRNDIFSRNRSFFSEVVHRLAQRAISPTPPWRANHPRVKQPTAKKSEPRMDTMTDGPPWMRRCHGRKPPPGARASRPQPYSCKQPAIQGHSLQQCTKPALAGFATMAPSPMRARRPRSRVGVLPFTLAPQRSRCRILQKAHPCVGLCVTWAHRHLLPPPTRLDTHRRCFPWADAHG